MTDKTTPPRGYRLVRRGSVRIGDRIFVNRLEKNGGPYWARPSGRWSIEVHTSVWFYHAVARKSGRRG